VGAVLGSTVTRTLRHLRRRGLLQIDEDGADPDVPGDPESNLAVSAVSAGPQWVTGLAPLPLQLLAYDKLHSDASFTRGKIPALLAKGWVR
jgi:hypothetical protein